MDYLLSLLQVTGRFETRFSRQLLQFETPLYHKPGEIMLSRRRPQRSSASISHDTPKSKSPRSSGVCRLCCMPGKLYYQSRIQIIPVITQ